MPDTIQRSFTAGELAPSLRVRADISKYASGLAECENFFVRAQGGVYNRAGFSYRETIGQIGRRARLIPFQFNTDQSYILLFEHLTMRVLKDGNYVEVSGVPYEIVTPYTEEQLSRLQYVQDADVMTIVHPDHDARDLGRVADDNWTLDVIDFSPSVGPPAWGVKATISISQITNANPAVVTTPAGHGMSSDEIIMITGVTHPDFVDLNNQAYKISALSSTTLGLIGVDKSAAGSPAGSGGSVIRAQLSPTGVNGGIHAKLFTYKLTTVMPDGTESIAQSARNIRTVTLSSTFGVELEWSAVPGASYYRIYKDVADGTGVFGWIGDAPGTSFVDFNIAPQAFDSPPEPRDPITGVDNRVSTVAYYQQRRIFANSFNEPQTVYTTQTGIYNSLRTSFPAAADDAITFTLKGRQINEIRHIIAVDSLILLTSGAEWKITEGQDQVLTPSTIGAKAQSYNGASWVQPVLVDTSAIYVQEKGSKIRDIGYQFMDDKFTGNDLSILSEHLFEDYQIEEMAYTLEPHGIVWAVRNDGVLLGLTYQKEQQVTAWHKHTTQGTFESVASISEDSRDALYVIVKRNINGADTRYIERLERRATDSPDNSTHLDSSLRYSGSLQNSFTNLQHLAGQEIVVIADGVVVEGLTVSPGSDLFAAGVVTIPRSAQNVLFGLPYTCAIETLQLDSAQEVIRGKHKKVSEVIIEMEKSRGGWIAPVNDNDGLAGAFVEIKPRFNSDGYGAIQLKTFKQIVTISPQWNRGGAVRLEQRTPMPIGVLAIIPTVDVS